MPEGCGRPPVASRAASLVAGNRSCSRFALCGLRPWTPPLTPPEASARHYIGERSEARAHNIGDYCQTTVASSRANLWCAERAGLKGRKREGLKPEGGRLDRRATAQCVARKPDLQGHAVGQAALVKRSKTVPCKPYWAMSALLMQPRRTGLLKLPIE